MRSGKELASEEGDLVPIDGENVEIEHEEHRSHLGAELIVPALAAEEECREEDGGEMEDHPCLVEGADEEADEGVPLGACTEVADENGGGDLIEDAASEKCEKDTFRASDEACYRGRGCHAMER